MRSPSPTLARSARPRARVLRWLGAALVLAAITAVSALSATHGGGSPTLSVFPSPGSRFASPNTQVSFRGAGPSLIRDVVVSGSRTGRHRGRLVAHSDRRGASFFPDRPFADGETVTVRARAKLVGGDGDGVSFRVRGSSEYPAPPPVHAASSSAPGTDRFVTRPDLRPSAVRVSTSTPKAASGDVFLAPKSGPGAAGPMIVDPHGRLVWFHPLPKGVEAFDLQVQHYEGRPVLTWWQGRLGAGNGQGVDEIYDTSYRPVAAIPGGNGYRPDLHEFKLTSRGTALVTAYHPVAADLSAVGGSRRGSVWDCVVQEIDVRTGAVEFEWHSLDHVGLAESYMHATDADTPFDYFHLNSIDVEPDGNLLISARHTHALYELDRRTGRILWRLGGKRSDFKLGPGVDFAWQHDAEVHPGGLITVFDNHHTTKAPGRQSQGMILRVDRRARTVRLVRDLRHDPGLLAPTQGNVQLLPGGDAFVGWGGTNQRFTEFDPAGDVDFDARLLEPKAESYRAYRFPWSATPATPPRAAAIRQGSQTTAYASWNGATGVAAWGVLAGDGPRALHPVARAAARGFETSIPVPGAARYVAVRAFDAHGAPLGTSPPVAVAAPAA